jgi:primase-polymerase (primpol)-like protein
MNLQSIPQELKGPSHWVCFQHDKTPVNPKTGHNAKANDPATWGTLAQTWGKGQEPRTGIGTGETEAK